MTQPKVEAGEDSLISSAFMPNKEAAKAMLSPIRNRQGKEIRPAIKSLLPGRCMPQSLKFLALSKRYQMSASDGMLYMKILVSSAAIENSASAPTAPLAAPIAGQPDKNTTVYMIRASMQTLVLPITGAFFIKMFFLALFFRTSSLYYNHNSKQLQNPVLHRASFCQAEGKWQSL